jgi:TPR repeat protein
MVCPDFGGKDNHRPPYMNDEGVEYLKQGQYGKPLEPFRKAGDQEGAKAQYSLGLMYSKG